MKQIDHNENPWITKTSEVVYESGWIKIHKDEVLNPAGKPAIYSHVEFKNIAIGIIPIDENNNTWLVGQYRYPTKSYSWEIIEGGGPLHIDPIESAKRELKEEAGIIAKEYRELMRLHLSNSATNELAIVYVVKGLSFEEAEPEESEVLQLKKLHITKAYEMCKRGEITDAISVAAIFKLILELESK